MQCCCKGQPVIIEGFIPGKALCSATEDPEHVKLKVSVTLVVAIIILLAILTVCNYKNLQTAWPVYFSTMESSGSASSSRGRC